MTGLDQQKFSVFELSQSMLVTHQKAPNQAKDLINMVCVTLEGTQSQFHTQELQKVASWCNINTGSMIP